MKDYPIQAAVKNAVEFHESCSTIVGFEVAEDAIQQTRDPGLKLEKFFEDFEPETTVILEDSKSKLEIKKENKPEDESNSDGND